MSFGVRMRKDLRTDMEFNFIKIDAISYLANIKLFSEREQSAAVGRPGVKSRGSWPGSRLWAWVALGTGGASRGQL